MKIIIRIFAFLLLISACFPAKTAEQSSTQHFSGKVVDADNGLPIALAHLNLLDLPGVGYTSDLQGNFSFYLKPPNGKTLRVKVSCIGYQSLTIELTPGQPTMLSLKEDVAILGEVIVRPVDYERLLLTQAIERIPTNYPQQMERLIGTTTEAGYADSTLQEAYYFAEAQVEADKWSYEKKQEYGNVRIVEGSTRLTPLYDSVTRPKKSLQFSLLILL